MLNRKSGAEGYLYQVAMTDGFAAVTWELGVWLLHRNPSRGAWWSGVVLVLTRARGSLSQRFPGEMSP